MSWCTHRCWPTAWLLAWKQSALLLLPCSEWRTGSGPHPALQMLRGRLGGWLSMAGLAAPCEFGACRSRTILHLSAILIHMPSLLLSAFPPCACSWRDAHVLALLKLQASLAHLLVSPARLPPHEQLIPCGDAFSIASSMLGLAAQNEQLFLLQPEAASALMMAVTCVRAQVHTSCCQTLAGVNASGHVRRLAACRQPAVIVERCGLRVCTSVC